MTLTLTPEIIIGGGSVEWNQ